ncbi:hypothetical protein AUP43_15635 [Oceanibaculum pacificum]|uniref:Uncharacterized protein n=1 Tax=Oceanibaculum pacificum TaxID=580166 RepID=A0A154WGN3_9PROT|nr:hypothetical protein AUP43_15635 [Oceanibaculum pacificum]
MEGDSSTPPARAMVARSSICACSPRARRDRSSISTTVPLARRLRMNSSIRVMPGRLVRLPDTSSLKTVSTA